PEPGREPAQAEQDQDGGHHLDQQLGGGEIGGGQPDEADAGDQPGPAHQHQGGEAMEFGQGGGADGARGTDQPQDGKGRVDGGQRLGARAQTRATGGGQAGGEGGENDEQQLGLQPVAGKESLDRVRAGVRQPLQQAFEDQLALDPS